MELQYHTQPVDGEVLFSEGSCHVFVVLDNFYVCPAEIYHYTTM